MGSYGSGYGGSSGDSGGGGGGSGYGSGYDSGSGGSSTSTKKKKARPQNPNKALVRLASRLVSAEQNQRAGAQQQVALANSQGGSAPVKFDRKVYEQSLPLIKSQIQKAFSGYTSKQVRQLAKKGGLPGEQADALVRAVGATEHNPNDAINTPLDYLSRPGQAVAAGIAERHGLPFNPGAALRGLQGKTNYSPIEATHMSLTGSRRGEATKFEKSLPGPVQFGGNVVLGALEDPTTYLTFGTTAPEQAAVRSAAADLAMSRAAQAVKTGAMSTIQYKVLRDAAAASRKTGLVTHDPQILKAAQDLAKEGKKALTPELKATLPKALQRKIRGAPGGVKIAGRPIPGTNLANTDSRIAKRLVEGDTKIALGRAQSGVEEATKPAAEIVRSTKVAYKEAKKLGLGREQVDARVLKALDVGNTPEDWATLSSAEHELATRIRANYDKITAEQQNVGLLGQGGEGMVSPTEYAARYLTPQARGELPAAFSGPTPATYTQNVSTKLSSKLGARAEDTRFTPQAELKDLTGAPKFEPNPSLAAVRRVGEAKRDVAHVESVNQLRSIRDAKGQPIALAEGDPGFETAAASGWKPIDLPTSQFNPQTGAVETASRQRVLVPAAIHPEVSRVFEVLTNPQAADKTYQQIAKVVQTSTKLWKGYATVFGPLGSGFVVRNMIGNVFNGFWLTGHMKTVVPDLAVAGGIQRKIAKGLKDGDWTARLSPREIGWVNEADKTRAIESGFFSHAADLNTSEDFTKTLSRGLTSKGAANPLNPENILLRKSRNANSALEDNARLGLYIRLRKQGYTAGNAAQVVHRYLFDYTDLGSTTQAIKKYVNPFFTWTRKNVPLQLEALAKTPGRITSQIHMLDAAQGLNPLDPRQVPGWANESKPIGIGGGSAIVPDLPITSALDSLKPATGIADDFKTFLQTGHMPPGWATNLARDSYNAIGVGGPLAGSLSAAGQVAAQRSIFTGAPIDPGAMIRTPSYLGGGWLPGAPKFIPQSLQVLLESAAPGLSKIRGTAPTTPQDKAKFAQRLASILGGQTVTPVNAAQARNNDYASTELLTTLRKWLESQGLQIPRGKYVTKSSSSYGG